MTTLLYADDKALKFRIIEFSCDKKVDSSTVYKYTVWLYILIQTVRRGRMCVWLCMVCVCVSPGAGGSSTGRKATGLDWHS